MLLVSKGGFDCGAALQSAAWCTTCISQQVPNCSKRLQVISDDLGLKLETTDISMMGRAKKITITKDDTIILDGSGDKAAIGERCDQIREAIAQSQSDYDR